MKSITVTTYKALNYGAVLQSFALQNIQGKLGIENYLLNYPYSHSVFKKLQFKLSRSLLIDIALNISTLFHYRYAKKLIYNFEQFTNEYLKTTDIYQMDELKKSPPIADFYISGSDQVIGIRNEWVYARMLNFVADNIPKFTYAASLAEYDWSENEKKYAISLMEKIDRISVREDYAKNYLENGTSLSCSVNIDPVFLLDAKKWNELAKEPQIKEKYILCYPLISNKNMQNAIDELKKKYGLKVISLQTNSIKRIRADKYIFDASPEEFLGWIKNAEFVVTTSFHGTAFSIIFERNFYSLIKEYKSQRIVELLEKSGLIDRLYNGKNEITEIDNFIASRNYIQREREKAISYLSEIKAICEKNRNKI